MDTNMDMWSKSWTFTFAIFRWQRPGWEEAPSSLKDGTSLLASASSVTSELQCHLKTGPRYHTRAIWHQAAPSSGNCKPPIHLPLIFRSWWTRVRTSASANPCSSLTLFHSIWSQSGLSDWRRLAERFLEACPLVPHQRLGAAIKLGFKPQRGLNITVLSLLPIPLLLFIFT